MFYVLGDGCLDAVVKKGDVDLRFEIFLENRLRNCLNKSLNITLKVEFNVQ